MSSRPPRLFGTDGIRGKALEGALAPAEVQRLGRALAELATERSREPHPRVLVARDPRTSGPVLRDALVAGLIRGGARVVDAGVMTTPGAAWSGERREASLTLVVSASHNPPEDNGVKVFEPGARKLDDAGERWVERRLAELSAEGATPTDGQGRATEDATLLPRYLDELARSEPTRLDGLTVVVDAGWGAAAGLASQLLARLGADVRPLHDRPDGRTLGLGVGAVYPQIVAAATAREKAHVGVAFDGDADRALFSDASGTVRDGDDVLYVLGRAFARRGQLAHQTLVGTSMTNGGLAAALSRSAERDSKGNAVGAIRVEHVDAVGDKFIGERLRAKGYVLGGEPSGHVIATRWLGTGDGLFTALAVLREMRTTGASLADLCAGFERFPQILEAEPALAGKPPLDSLPGFAALLREKSEALGRLGGRLVVRYSGTEPLLRVMAEGPASADLAAIVRAVREAYRTSERGS